MTTGVLLRATSASPRQQASSGSAKSKSEPSSDRATSWLRRSVSRSDLLAVTTQLSIMCESEIDLAAALQSISKECRHPVLRQTFERVSADVNGGALASVAMGRHPQVFGAAYLASIAAGEASGSLKEVLARLCQLLKNEIRLRNSIASLVA